MSCYLEWCGIEVTHKTILAFCSIKFNISFVLFLHLIMIIHFVKINTHIIIGMPSFIILDGNILNFSLRLDEPIMYNADKIRVMRTTISAWGHSETPKRPMPRGMLWTFRYTGEAKRMKLVGWEIGVMKGMSKLRRHMNADNGVNYNPLMTDLLFRIRLFVLECSYIWLWVCNTIIIIQIEMRIKGRLSLKKLDKEKPMNMTMASAIFSSKDKCNQTFLLASNQTRYNL